VGFTLNFPPPFQTPAYFTGFGSRVRVVADTPFSIGQTVEARLTQNDASGIVTANVIATAKANVAGSSRLTDLIWGIDSSGPNAIPSNVPLAGPFAFYSNVANLFVDVTVAERDGSGLVIDGPQTFFQPYYHDPVSQVGNALLGFLSDRIDREESDLLAATPGPISLRAPHAGLTGTGSLAEAAPRGARVQLTTVNPGWGWTGETPRRSIPQAASVQFPDGTRFPDSHPIHYEDQLVWADRVPATSLRYNVRPGFVATITAFD